jgi:hypothetical protein
LVLGACVPPAVGDAFCGRAARIGAKGCAFRECGNDEALDVATGGCIPRVSLTHGGVIACGERSLPVVESRQIGCVSLDATCPRGTDRVADVCVHGPLCPPGTLQDGTSCRPVVAAGGRMTGRRVDVGAWTALALGIDGGSGSAELCRPLALRPGVFALPPGETATLRIRVALSLPDEDLSRLHADIQSIDAEGHPSIPPVEALVSDAVGTMLEPLRALGGEASTAALHLEVRCTVGVLRGSPLRGSS